MRSYARRSFGGRAKLNSKPEATPRWRWPGHSSSSQMTAIFGFGGRSLLAVLLLVASGVPGATAASAGDVGVLEGATEPGFHLRKRSADPQDYALSNTDLQVINGVAGDVAALAERHSDVGTGPEDGLVRLRASAAALGNIKDRLADPTALSSMPPEFSSAVRSLARELSRAEGHLRTVEGIVSDHLPEESKSAAPQPAESEVPGGRRALYSGAGGRTTVRVSGPGVSKADYFVRSKSPHFPNMGQMGHAPRVDTGPEHQQGYHGARPSREAGTGRRLSRERRLNADDAPQCVNVDETELRAEQCLRLASCAQNYNMYDLFVFLFGDDIDFSTGQSDSRDEIEAFEIDYPQKLSDIKSRSSDILSKYSEDVLNDLSIVAPGGTCEKLLQEFYRFDEDLSVHGKWQGGSVTGVCRGWGTNRYMTLDSMYEITSGIVIDMSPFPNPDNDPFIELIGKIASGDKTAENFVVGLFSEYLGCAVDLVEALLTDGTDRKPIFANQPSRYNPYSPDGTTQFQIPVFIKEGAVDEYGQLTAEHLDEIFEYAMVGDIDNNQALDTSGTTVGFNDMLKFYLGDIYHFGSIIDGFLGVAEECRAPLAQADCDGALAALAPLQQTLLATGLARSSLDDSLAIIFGNRTTIGQVCSYARGLEAGTVEDLPGFCCLDAPYETQNWGEKYECLKYTELADGSTKIVQKSIADCNRLGPVTSGFNEASCDIFHGTWCPSPRDCSPLKVCIDEAKQEVEASRSRQAFFNYLDGAPKVEDPNDPVKCGELREYFEYDRDYADDSRICKEVRDLQCFTDFSNLDGFATGTAGSAGGPVELAVSEDLTLITKVEFDGTAAKAWRNSNFAIAKAIEITNFVLDQIEAAEGLCLLFVSAVPGTAAPCEGPASAAKIVASTILFALEVAVSISEQLYSEIVDGQDGDYSGDRSNSIYENVITNHGNIIATFYATQQVKVMLGELADAMADEEDEDDRRRRLSDCVSTAHGYSSTDCSAVSCEDPTRMCDGSFNFPYVAYLKGAGCDTLDSDGDGTYDVCEDRFPPQIVVRDAKIFRCDIDDDSKLCYDQEVFKSEAEVKHFLKYEFPATDDCSPTGNLEVSIEHKEGSCRDTVYTLTPAQNIPSCDGREPVGTGLFPIEYENPLYGNPRDVTINLDDVAPVVQCGFKEDESSLNIVEGNKTLYSYMPNFDINGLRLEDSLFYYHVTENCEDDIRVNLVVKSNEIQQNGIAILQQKQIDGFVEQVQLLYAATSCENMGQDLFCEKDPSMQRVKVRFYDITVSAHDSAGNIGSDSCRVVVVPRCSGLSECEEYQASGNFFYPLDMIHEEIAQTQVLHKVTEADLIWEQGLDFNEPEALQNDCEDRCPPKLVFDAELFQCDETDLSKRCYDGKMFASEVQVMNFFGNHVSARDDCSSTNTLGVNVEYALGSCRDTVYTLTPVHVCNANDSVSDLGNPQHSTSEQFTVRTDYEAPVVQCGFKEKSESINILDGKTLYHYVTTYNQASDGMKMDDAGFFYNVTDNCEEDVQVKVVVTSNEIQQHDSAKLVKFKMTHSVEQAELLYAAASCESSVEEGMFCKKDPTMQSLKARFYDITVTATDTAGNSGSDTCKVVIVPKCTNSPAGCEARTDIPIQNVNRKLQSGRRLAACAEPYSDGIAHQIGDLVSAVDEVTTVKYNYKCISDMLCGLEAYGPNKQGEILAWDKGIQECSDETPGDETSDPPPLWSEDGFCPDAYEADTPYKPMQVVSVDGRKVFQCRESPKNMLCSMSGYAPGVDRYWPQAWEKLDGECSGDAPEGYTFSFESSSFGSASFGIEKNFGCPDGFVAGTQYGEGDTVTVQNRIFSCKPWPNSDYCSMAAYEPLSSTAPDAYLQAWDLIGPCNNYERRDATDAAVAESQFQLPVAEAELVWKHGLDMPY